MDWKANKAKLVALEVKTDLELALEKARRIAEIKSLRNK